MKPPSQGMKARRHEPRPDRYRSQPLLRTAAFILALAVCIACGDDGTRNGEGQEGTKPVDSGLSMLHATRGEAPGIFDEQGRQVLLRGINYNSLGDYYQADERYPPTVPVMRDDLPRMASLGFNAIRLVLSWSYLEPQRDVFSDAYLDRIEDFVMEAGRYGIYVVLDMHQDAWGKYIATPPDEVCRSGFEPALGWDGAPEWATLTDGRPTCKLLVRELSPAVAQAFQSFWANREGIQTEFIRGWTRLAEKFATTVNVAGYNLFNEPNPGFTVGRSDTVFLGDFYRRLIEAIRDAEDAVPEGFRHIVFFEPSAFWSAFGSWVVPNPDFTTDENIVFAPHIYADSHVCFTPGLTIEDGFRLARTAADRFGTTFWSGEWNFGELTRAGDAERVAEYGRMEDRHLVGGAFWQWRFACGDPHMIQKFGGSPPPETIRLIRNGCPGDVDLGYVEPYAVVLSRAYPRAAPGRLTAVTSDPVSGELEITGRTVEEGILDCWVPDRGRGDPEPSGDHIFNPGIRRVPGGWRIQATASSTYHFEIRFPSRRNLPSAK